MQEIAEREAQLPPQSLEAEQAVLGAILFRPDAFDRIAGMLTPDDFYRGPHRLIFKAMQKLQKLGHPIDIVSVSEVLNDAGDLDGMGGRPYLMDLTSSVSTAENIVYYAEIIQRKSRLRAIIEAGWQMVEDAHDGEDDAVVLDSAQAALLNIAHRKDKTQLHRVGDTAQTVFAEIQERKANPGRLIGVPTGFHDLDTYLAGLQKSDLLILAARPSMGKTGLALNIAANVARNGNTVLFFSLEMSKGQLVQRLISCEAEVNGEALRSGDYSIFHGERIMQAVGDLGNWPMFIDETGGITVQEMRSKARIVQQQQGEIGLIVVDYLQLMSGTKSRGKEAGRVEEVSEISRGLKALAKDLQVPVLALSQLSRAVESRQDKKPMLSDLRESGSIEQDADIVMFIYRDEYYNKDSERPGAADIIIAKQRNGPVGEVSLIFRNQITKFINPCDRKVTIY